MRRDLGEYEKFVIGKPRQEAGGEMAAHLLFQAEDGIRDGHVTGVQTCALPISSPSPPSTRVKRFATSPSAAEWKPGRRSLTTGWPTIRRPSPDGLPGCGRRAHNVRFPQHFTDGSLAAAPRIRRRCDSGWTPLVRFGVRMTSTPRTSSQPMGVGVAIPEGVK